MPPNLTAADVDALERRNEQATSVDGINVDKDVLRDLVAAWRCWQNMQAVPSGYSVAHYTHGWTVEPRCKREWVCPHALDAIAAADDLAAALAAAFKEGTDAD